jgi:glutathione S-transferase
MSPEAENFVLRTTLTSPFGRKARMAVDILGLSGRVSVEHADTADENDTLRQQNPLGKIPCLVRPDGTAVFDSSVIVEFLQDVAGTDQLVPARGPARIRTLTMARLADGIIDAGALIIYEERYHQAGAQSEYWLAHQRGKILRALAVFESSPPAAGKTDAVAIGLSCALAFLDKRKAVKWRPSSPRLVAWLEAFERSEPAFERTKPPSA